MKNLSATMIAHALGLLGGAISVEAIYMLFNVHGGGLRAVVTTAGLIYLCAALSDTCTRRMVAARRLIWPLVVALPVCLMVMSVLTHHPYGHDIDGRAMLAITALVWAIFTVEWLLVYTMFLALSVRRSKE